MATLLLKDIHRETLAVTDMSGRKMIVTLEAGDMLTFRAKGKRFKYTVPIQACYNLALIYTVNQRWKERMRAYNEKRKMGLRTRKPKKLPPIFNQKMYEALKLK